MPEQRRSSRLTDILQAWPLLSKELNWTRNSKLQQQHTHTRHPTCEQPTTITHVM
jgi:hypothetical protein